MSTVYNLEPQPTAKVILHTTSGDLLLELFAQQTPLTSRNFLQLCLDGYYDNTIFHRLVPGFIIQGGDPTGTGSGGESSFDAGKPFEDEFHSRLKFNRRGLLGMANTGDKDDNGSQFFLTLGNTPELTGRNTMFGRVEGNTIFNLVKMGEADLVDEEGSERPMYPTKVTGTEVLVNPFEGMEARIRIAARKVEEAQPKKKTVKKKAGKQLLSFGGEDGEETVSVKPAAKFNPKLVSEAKDTKPPAPTKRPAPPSMEERAPKRRLSPSPPRKTVPPPVRAPALAPSKSPSPPPTRPTPTTTSLLETTNAQIAALKSSLKRSVPTPVASSSSKKTALEAMIPITSTRGRKRKGGGSASMGVALSREEQRTMDEFNAFRRRLDAAAPTVEKSAKEERVRAGAAKGGERGKEEEEEDEEARLCDLHFIADCLSCGRWDGTKKGDGGATTGEVDEETAQENENEEGDWMSHTLTFAKDRLGKDLEWKRQNERELVVIDPREKEKDLGVKGGKKGGKRE